MGNSMISSSLFQRLQKTSLCMAKGDGKKKRKKQADNEAQTISTPGSTNSESSPRRVSSNINIPVRHQIRMAQLSKELDQQASTSFRQKKVERTAYRRTWDEEEIEQKAEERRRRGKDPDWNVILNRTLSDPLVVVDGYNIIHKWSRFKKHMTKGDPQKARELLIDDLENLRSLKGWRIEVVFDGTKRATIGPLGHGPGNNRPSALDKANKASVSKYGVRTVFTGVGLEADSYIEKRCAEAKNVTFGELTGSFIVASDDLMIRLAAQNAGAHVMGAERFVNELKAVKKAVDYRVEAAIAAVNGHSIRPVQLRGTSLRRFGRRSVLIEDKRKKRKEEDLIEAFDVNLDVTEEEGIPWWAQIPNHTHVIK